MESNRPADSGSDALSTMYDPSSFEETVKKRWIDGNAFDAVPDSRAERFVVMMPLPNVTGALHMGHAMDNVMQDLLVRWHRMMGDNTLWMPGTDHAGIATQALVEKRLRELEGVSRHDMGRERLVERIWEWKNRFQERIVSQQQSMGCSCDWKRQRFTLDEVCSRAVYAAFFRLFRDTLIFRGRRIVNWDCALQTAVADDEIEYKTTRGHFWHLRYPVMDPKPGEPNHVVIATTRPETLFGDTAVACHPDPAGQFDVLIRSAGSDSARAELLRRKESHLNALETLARMARDGRRVRVPLVDRVVPMVLDEWAKPEMGSGAVKITPAHDPNDYGVWQRHVDEIGSIVVMNPDGTLNGVAGKYAGSDRLEARPAVVAELAEKGFLESVEEREIEVAYSDRSKTPIEPYLSLQWFVRMEDLPQGVKCGAEAGGTFDGAGLAQIAIDAVEDGRVSFHPNKRFGATFVRWLSEKRDWCISRQLWWGHRIPIWSLSGDVARLEEVRRELSGMEGVCSSIDQSLGDGAILYVCVENPAERPEILQELEQLGLERDPDVLDTWFSSALWPLSTLGWPDPVRARQEPGQPSLERCLDHYYPGSCLVTGRDIITLWVARMVVMGLYLRGEVPFSHVFVHANILDGKGERMSKSKGNGIDPLDIIARNGTDAMRYVLCDLQTGLQDIRLPVQVDSPYSGRTLDVHALKHGSTTFTYLCPDSGKEFDVLGTLDHLPSAQPYSDRFEEGRRACNKIWNAARFAFEHLRDESFRPLSSEDLLVEDRWILSRLNGCVSEVRTALEAYNPSAALNRVIQFFRGDFCDWYLEIVKPRVAKDDRVSRQLLGFCLDRSLRLLHPFIPFITEELWSRLNAKSPRRGLLELLDAPDLLCVAEWPEADAAFVDTGLERELAKGQQIVRAVRDLRNQYGIARSRPLEVELKAAAGAQDGLRKVSNVIRDLANLGRVEIGSEFTRKRSSAVVIVEEAELYVLDVIDIDKERVRLTDSRGKLEKRIEAAERKLANESFVQRADPVIVRNERENLAELKRQYETLLEALKDLEEPAS